MSKKPTYEKLEKGITGLKRTDQALRESEEKYRQLFATVSDAIMVFCPETREFLDVNEAALEMYGYSKEEFLSLRHSDITTEPEESNMSIKQVLSGELKQIPLRYHKRKNGRTFPVEISSGTFKLGDRQVLCRVIRDITERQQIEEALRKSEKKYRGIFNESIAAIYVFDKKKNFIDSNQAGLDLLGYSREELLNMSIPEVDADPIAVLPAHDQLLSGDRIINYEHQLKRKDGKVVTVLNNSRPITNVTGHVIGMQSTLIDITQRKKAEDALRESEGEYRLLMNNLPGFVYKGFKDWSVEFYDNAVELLTGYNMHIFNSRKIKWVDLIIPEDIEPAKQAFVQAFKTDKSYVRDYRIKTTAGDIIWIQERGSIVCNENGDIEYVSGILFDITKRKQAEEQIKASLKEKEVLLQEIHHRVKNNMQVISSLLRLQAASVGDERITDALMESQGRVEAMAFVHETLYGSDTLAVVDFETYLSKIANQIFQTHKTGMDRVKLEVDTRNIKLGLEDAIPLGLITNELVTNSLKYAFPENRSGEIVIRLRAIEQDSIEFVFSDNGIGIPESLDWRNTDSLGLRLVIILAENQLDGTVSLDRSSGTHFTVRFRHEENQ